MNCREFEADIVDLAREADRRDAVTRRLGAHLEACDQCAARLERERHLTAHLKALADSVPSSPRAPAIEQELLRALAERHADLPRSTPASEKVFATLPARWWLAAAAVLLVTTAAWLASVPWWPAQEVQPVSISTTVKSPAPNPAVGEAAERVEQRTAAQSTDAGRRAPALQAPAARSGDIRRYGTGDGEVLSFVTLPSALGLPGLESGRIMRVELSTLMLPAFGFDVDPEIPSSTIEADVLVGQDGQPRAIRFVSLDSTPRRRQ